MSDPKEAGRGIRDNSSAQAIGARRETCKTLLGEMVASQGERSERYKGFSMLEKNFTSTDLLVALGTSKSLMESIYKHGIFAVKGYQDPQDYKDENVSLIMIP